MQDQTVVVTGANRGLGLELCRQLAAGGARVIGTARRPHEAEELRALDVRVEELDVADAASVRGFAGRLGEAAVDVLVNNAGRGGAGSGIAELDLEASLRFFDVNSLGPLRVTQALLPHLRRGRAKKVVHVTSQMGSLANNAAGGYYAYRASKAALNMLHLTLARELAGQGFTCVAIHPGWVRTAMGGEQAPLAPEESARGMLRVLAGLSRQDHGSFLDHTGAKLPW